jgi:hypothetical protein
MPEIYKQLVLSSQVVMTSATGNARVTEPT